MDKEFLNELSKKAIQEIEKELENLIYKPKQLENSEFTQRFNIEKYKKIYSGFLQKSKEKVFIAIPNKFPEEDLEVYVKNKKLIETLPHIESSGRICLNPPNEDYHPYYIISRSKERIEKADILLSKSPENITEDELIEEIKSYWILNSRSNINFISIFNPASPSRIINYYELGGVFYFSDNSNFLNNWLNRHFGWQDKISFSKAIFLWRDSPILPKDFPKNSKNLEKLYPEAENIFKAKELQGVKNIPVLFGFLVNNEPVILGMIMEVPEKLSRGSNKKRKYMFYVSKYRTVVERVDLEWLMYRGGADWINNLHSKKVALIGCGSLGSGVAELLCKSGIGKLTIIDPDVLTFANIARHSLGASKVGSKKAIALKNKLEKDFPHIEFNSYPYSWTEILNEIEEHDLIISTMAIWKQNVLLNRTSFKRSIRPIIYAWLEPYSLAAHAVVIRKSDSCLECGFYDIGKPKLYATEWERNIMRQEPGCASSYQPYGALDILPGQRLVTEMAVEVLSRNIKQNLRYFWLGDTNRLKKLGGNWYSEWEKNVVNPGEGEINGKIEWQSDDHCEVCGG